MQNLDNIRNGGQASSRRLQIHERGGKSHGGIKHNTAGY